MLFYAVIVGFPGKYSILRPIPYYYGISTAFIE